MPLPPPPAGALAFQEELSPFIKYTQEKLRIPGFHFIACARIPWRSRRSSRPGPLRSVTRPPDPPKTGLS